MNQDDETRALTEEELAQREKPKQVELWGRCPMCKAEFYCCPALHPMYHAEPYAQSHWLSVYQDALDCESAQHYRITGHKVKLEPEYRDMEEA